MNKFKILPKCSTKENLIYMQCIQYVLLCTTCRKTAISGEAVKIKKL